MTTNHPTIATNFGVRSTFVEVNLSLLSRNLQAIRKKVSPEKIMIVVKANAYGQGLTEVSKYLDPQEVIHGKKYLQVGCVFMDQIMVNIEQDPAFNGDEVSLIGEAQNGERVTVEELAEWAGTIPYEILTNINTRVPRIYITEGSVYR